jgi:hypothetical protein
MTTDTNKRAVLLSTLKVLEEQSTAACRKLTTANPRWAQFDARAILAKDLLALMTSKKDSKAYDFALMMITDSIDEATKVANS